MGLPIAGSLHILVKIHRKMCIRLKRPILHYDEVVVASLTTGVRKHWLSPTYIKSSHVYRHDDTTRISLFASMGIKIFTKICNLELLVQEKETIVVCSVE